MKLFEQESEYLFKIAVRSDASVLITGPTGTGKTTLARQIHDGSVRSAKPFVTINLASVHESTLESELFGHERGAFTGAEQKRIGRLECANGGTVFFDEIGELPARLQARLLEFLQNKTITPVGSNRPIMLDVRVITATHKDLQKSMKNGEFREDLFHRLRLVEIPMKTLNERRDEFDSIVHDVLCEICKSLGRSIHKISDSLASHLEAYSWPGNFRELRNVLEFCVLASSAKKLDVEHLPPWFCTPGTGALAFSVPDPIMLPNYYEALSTFERSYLETALSRSGGRINRTARRIGIHKTTLCRRLRAYSIVPPQPEEASAAVASPSGSVGI